MSLRMTAFGLFGLLMIVFPTVSAQGCVYNGMTYQDGDAIKNICIDITCVGGQWTTTGTFIGECRSCSLSDDPHICTFDRNSYDWHGSCNYSISQLGYGFYEDFGIYGQFQQCGRATCVHETTFTDNPNTVIEIDHGSLGTVLVNGNSFTLQPFIEGIPAPNQPVLAWESDGCNMFLGSQGYLLMTCPNQIFVWAFPDLVHQVNGLCGYFNFDRADDFTDRNRVVHPLTINPTAFPLSWMTDEQSVNRCKKNGGEDPCKDEAVRMKMFEECEPLLRQVQWEENAPSDLTLKLALMNCATDLCNLAEHETRRGEIEEWKKKMQMMLVNNIMIEARTKKCIRGRDCE